MVIRYKDKYKDKDKDRDKDRVRERGKDKEKKTTLTDIKVAVDHPVGEVADAEQDSREATHWIPAV